MIRLVPHCEFDFDAEPRRFPHLSGSQAPCAYVKDDSIIIGLTARDGNGYSRPRFIRMSKSDFLDNEPHENFLEGTLGLSNLEGSYVHGLLLSQIMDNSTLYTGWTNKDNSVERWETRGLLDCCSIWQGLVPYPNLEETITSMPFQDDRKDVYFMEFSPWVDLGGRLEPFYGISVQRNTGKVEQILKGDKCYCRPVVYTRPDKVRELWYCHRNLVGYKEHSKDAYKLGVLREIDDQWVPVNHEVSMLTDDFQMAYPFPFVVDNRIFVLYNNDKSMRGKVQVAEVFYE